MVLIKGKVLNKIKLDNISLLEILGKNGVGYQVYKIRFFNNNYSDFDKFEVNKDCQVPVSLSVYKDNIQFNYAGSENA